MLNDFTGLLVYLILYSYNLLFLLDFILDFNYHLLKHLSYHYSIKHGEIDYEPISLEHFFRMECFKDNNNAMLIINSFKKY